MTHSYFFCGIGGSGMMPLALIVRARGADVAGSDRSLDQGRIAAKFDWLTREGIALFPQDGSGVTRAEQIVVASAAIEATVPDIVAADRLGCTRLSRAELLAQIFNASTDPVGVAGTSGKSTVTGMIGWIFHVCGQGPTVMNGAVMKNFVSAEAPFASALVGRGERFISEVDESDGSIALFNPGIAVLNNIALDHKTMEELRDLFGGFVSRARVAVLNIDNDEVVALARPGDITCSMGAREAVLQAGDFAERPDGVDFRVNGVPVSLQVPGRHNASNALMALGAAVASGIALEDAAQALAGFTGLRRRLELVGTSQGVTVIDDFGHNPDKISATLDTLLAFPGRLLVFFQPHGFGPLKLIGEELAEVFAAKLGAAHQLALTDPVYFGGTVDKSRGGEWLADQVCARGSTAHFFDSRDAVGDWLASTARAGDRIVIMGARDDTLSSFAEQVLARV
ncbi:MAG: UDP-N-acetylmuramate--alanine ligase [Sphingomonadales bacterium]|nr:UDP-N-acetylmuramate--alanine ligase [Sphingomonadales bacterium]